MIYRPNIFVKHLILPLIFTMAFLSSCKKDVPEPDIANRTVLVYMVPDNKLLSYCKNNIIDMSYAMQKHYDGNLVVYVDSPDDVPYLLNITKNRIDTVKTYPELDSVSASTMKRVFSDVKTQYSASSYGAILWSHGTGWLPQIHLSSSKAFSASPSYQYAPLPIGFQGIVKAFGYDEQRYMNVEVLSDALPKDLDFIIFDTCLMGTVELAYQLRNHCKYFLSSPTEILGNGFPYLNIVPYLFSTNANLNGIAEAFYNYYDAMSGDYRSASISLVKTSELSNLAKITSNIITSHWDDIQQLNSKDFLAMDRMKQPAMFDFNQIIQTISTSDEYNDFKTQFDKAVVYSAHTPTFFNRDLSNCSGLSMYIPLLNGENAQKYNDYYSTLDWSVDVGISTLLGY